MQNSTQSILQHIDPDKYEELVRYLKYASSAYSPICPRPNGNKLILQISNPLSDMQGFVARDDTKKEIVVSLRGRYNLLDHFFIRMKRTQWRCFKRFIDWRSTGHSSCFGPVHFTRRQASSRNTSTHRVFDRLGFGRFRNYRCFVSTTQATSRFRNCYNRSFYGGLRGIIGCCGSKKTLPGKWDQDILLWIAKSWEWIICEIRQRNVWRQCSSCCAHEWRSTNYDSHSVGLPSSWRRILATRRSIFREDDTGMFRGRWRYSVLCICPFQGNKFCSCLVLRDSCNDPVLYLI